MFTQINSFVLGMAAGVILTAALAFPRVGRLFARIVATVAMAAGLGMMTWALLAVSSHSTLRAIQVGTLVISQSGEGLGWSVAFLAGGITALVLSFLGGSAR